MATLDCRDHRLVGTPVAISLGQPSGPGRMRIEPMGAQGIMKFSMVRPIRYPISGLVSLTVEPGAL